MEISNLIMLYKLKNIREMGQELYFKRVGESL